MTIFVDNSNSCQQQPSALVGMQHQPVVFPRWNHMRSRDGVWHVRTSTRKYSGASLVSVGNIGIYSCIVVRVQGCRFVAPSNPPTGDRIDGQLVGVVTRTEHDQIGWGFLRHPFVPSYLKGFIHVPSTKDMQQFMRHTGRSLEPGSKLLYSTAPSISYRESRPVSWNVITFHLALKYQCRKLRFEAILRAGGDVNPSAEK